MYKGESIGTRTQQFTRTRSTERALLVAVASKERTGGWSVEDSLDELAQLAKSAGASVVGRVIQHLPSPTKISYVGKGKLDELIELQETAGYNVVIFDDELTPLQQQNLEEALKVKVIDRAALILDIFARRARTREGQLQVELAQHQYLLPRLAGQWSHLERLGGGIGTRGPGESQIETDRRLIKQKIQRLKAQLEKVRKHRQLHRRQRERRGIPVVALVGYTNTGKSTLLNALSRADVLAKDELFSTLDPTTRRLVLPDKSAVLMTDTVGFIKKLPPMLLAAFRATLEELNEADVLLHVVDLSSRNAAEQCQTVEEILKDLDLADKPRITALNKIDLLLDPARTWDEDSAIKSITEECETTDENSVLVAATKKWGLNRLREVIREVLAKNSSSLLPPQNMPQNDAL